MRCFRMNGTSSHKYSISNLSNVQVRTCAWVSLHSCNKCACMHLPSRDMLAHIRPNAHGLLRAQPCRRGGVPQAGVIRNECLNACNGKALNTMAQASELRMQAQN